MGQKPVRRTETAQIAKISKNNTITQKNKYIEPQVLKQRKALMYQALCKTYGVVTEACEECGVSRWIHYHWLKTDPNYKLWVDQLPEMLVDFGETSLRKLIEEGSEKATTFLLKCKGKRRDWVEKQEINHTGLQEIKISFDTPSSEREVIDVEAKECIEHQDQAND